MSWVGVGIVGGALVSGIAGTMASGSAADAQENASNTASSTELQKYEEGRADTAPWRDAGANALATLMQKINAGPGDYTKSPYYQTGLAEGEKAINRSAAAKGGLLGGRTLKDITRFGEDYALKDYQNWLGNYYQSLTPFQSVAGLGMTTANQSAANADQVGSQLGSNALYTGNAQATGSINQANAVTGAANSGINNYLMWKYLNPGGTTAAGVSAYGSSSAYNPNYSLGTPQLTEIAQ
jgi:hypothetical protein